MTKRFDMLASNEAVLRTQKALIKNRFHAEIVQTSQEALERVKELIPPGVTITNGASVTLEQIGLVDYLKSGEHGWDNLHAAIIAEKDPQKQSRLRQKAVHADYYLGSVHGVSESGELVIASATGSQLPSLAFTSPNIILVISTQKIMPTLAEAIRRLEEYVIPLEDKRMRDKTGLNTTYAKTLILHQEGIRSTRNVTIILVNEKLGF